MRNIIKVTAALLVVLFCAAVYSIQAKDEPESSPSMQSAEAKMKKADGNSHTPSDFREIEFNTIDGEPTNLAAYADKVKLIVNVASKCGFTPQYQGLEDQYRKFKDRGFVVIGFPANNFNHQEPGTDEEIKEFCTSKYDVTFPMMSKISVKGDDIHPLYAYLTTHSDPPGEITWNFNKFLLDQEGNIVARWPSDVKPTSDEITNSIEKVLKEEEQTQ